MAIYHLHMKAISRSRGRSATAAAAYRLAARIECSRTGDVHDYTRKRGVVHTSLVLPRRAPAWARDRAELWNRVEQAERRKNSTVAREFEVALPAELSPSQRVSLVEDFARALSSRHRMVVDAAIHAPHRKGDQRNHHAHLLCSTRRLEAEGFTEKTRELDLGRKSGELQHWREAWANLVNRHLRRAQVEARVDHRSLEEQGVKREPGIHLGPIASAMERRGVPTRRGDEFRTRRRASRFETAEEADRMVVATRQEAASRVRGDERAEVERREAVAAAFRRLEDRAARAGVKIELHLEQELSDAFVLPERQRAERVQATLKRNVDRLRERMPSAPEQVKGLRSYLGRRARQEKERRYELAMQRYRRRQRLLEKRRSFVKQWLKHQERILWARLYAEYPVLLELKKLQESMERLRHKRTQRVRESQRRRGPGLGGGRGGFGW